MSGVVQILVEGYIEEDIQSVLNPSIKIPGVWSGSGFFVKYKELEGYIVTNAHVARNAVKVEICSMLTSEERFEAEVIGLVKKLEPDVAFHQDLDHPTHHPARAIIRTFMFCLRHWLLKIGISGKAL